MKHAVVKSNLHIMLNNNGYANYDVGSDEKLSVISFWNLIGRLIKWIRNLNGGVTKRVNLAVLHTLQEMQKSHLTFQNSIPILAKKLIDDPQFITLSQDPAYRQIFDITKEIENASKENEDTESLKEDVQNTIEPILLENTATKLQAIRRAVLAKRAFKKMKEEAINSQKSASVVTPPQQIAPQNIKNSTTQLQTPLNNPPKSSFQCYSLEMKIPGSTNLQNIDIKSDQDVEKLVNTLVDQVTSLHAGVGISFDRSVKLQRINDEGLKLEKFPLAQDKLIFEIIFYNYPVIAVRPKPELVETLNCGKARLTYPNGIIEICSPSQQQSQFFSGTRLFPDGRKEVGEFSRLSGKLETGYCVGTDNVISYRNPKSFITCEKESDGSEFLIVEVEGKLTPIKKMWKISDYEFESSDLPLSEVLLKACRYREGGDGKSVLPLLQHPEFEHQLDAFLDEIFKCDGMTIMTTPPLFECTHISAQEILEIAASRRVIDPLKIVDPVTGRNFFMEAAYRGNIPLLEKMIDLFPTAFATDGNMLLSIYLECGHKVDFAMTLAQKWGNQIDPFLIMHIQVARKRKIDPKAFDLLDGQHKKKLYDAAYLYNNPFLYEPALVPVKPNEYSVNLTWIDKMQSTDKILSKVHVQPIAEWAKANPGSAINIWIDSELTDIKAVEEWKKAIDHELFGTSHGTVNFRDVRSIDFVQKNPSIFTDKIDKDFRADFLRQIIGNHILQNKESKYFVYSAFNKNPLTCEELFDQRSLDFLQEFGFILKKGGFAGYDDNFEILNGENAQLMDSHSKVMIDLTLEMILDDPKYMRMDQIHGHYPALFAHLMHNRGTFGKYIGWDKTDKNLQDFRPDIFNSSSSRTIIFEKGKVNVRKTLPMKPLL